jgi:hypothetical protein
LRQLNFSRSNTIVGIENKTRLLLPNVIRIGASLHIFHTSLESLDLPLLETIGNGGVFIKNNPRLCYVNRINWNYVRLNPDEKLTIVNNADPRQCGKTRSAKTNRFQKPPECKFFSNALSHSG